MLFVFLGEHLVESLRSLSWDTDSKLKDRLDNIWLISGRVFDAINHGEIYFNVQPWAFHPDTSLLQTYNIKINDFLPHSGLKRMPSSMSSVRIENRMPNIAPILSEDFLNIHSRFSQSMAWMEAAIYMKTDRQPLGITQKWWLPDFLTRPVFSIFRFMLSFLHKKVRAYIYDGLIRVGIRLYGLTLSDVTFRAPFGLYIRRASKTSAMSHEAEKATLDMVQKFTSVPSPRAIDSLMTAQHSYLVMTGVRGRPISHILDVMTDEQLKQIVLDLKGYISQLRQITRPSAFNYQICNSLGGGILDWRIPDSQREELRYESEDEFNYYLTQSFGDQVQQQAAKSHNLRHQIVFTHGDLNPRNILVEDGRITGIVDWENAGWFPEYWEYTKAHYCVRSLIRWLADVIDTTFQGYRDELVVENMLSDLTSPF